MDSLLLLIPLCFIGATLYGVNRTKMDAVKPTNILDPGLAGGKVRCFIDTYVGLATESAADVIEMGPTLPKGAKILWGSLTCNAIGGTPDLGDAEDTDRYIDEAADNAVTMFDDVITGIGYEIDETVAATLDSQMIITLDATVTLAGVFTLVVFYTVE